MKEKFIERYRKAILDYFSYTGDSEGSLVRHYIVGEYKKILCEEFQMSEDEVAEMYRKLYWQTHV